jgi:hypothetical protein
MPIHTIPVWFQSQYGPTREPRKAMMPLFRFLCLTGGADDWAICIALECRSNRHKITLRYSGKSGEKVIRHFLPCKDGEVKSASPHQFSDTARSTVCGAGRLDISEGVMVYSE